MNTFFEVSLSELTKKLARTCGKFLKIRNLLPTSKMVCDYNALFPSFLQYGIIVWGQTYVLSVFKMQKRAIKTISHQCYLAHSLPIFKELKLPHYLRIFFLN